MSQLDFPRPPAWTADALCIQVDADLFFPPKGGAGGRDARRVCRACPVIAECLAYALEHHERLDGIWGGTSEMQRRKMVARNPKPITHGTEGGYKTHRRRGETPCGSCLEAARAAKARRRAGAA